MKTQNRVMFVDDEEGVRLSWNRFLSDRGFEVTTAPDGDAAIEALEVQPVDVVVSDLRMPGKDGLDLLNWVRDNKPETQFILLTGYGDDGVEEMARKLGAYDYLNKPISPEALATIITAASHLGMLDEMVPGGGTEVLEAPALRTAEATEAREYVDVDGALVELVDAEAVQPRGVTRSVGEILFGLVVAPILGLLFVMFLPVIGIGALLWVMVQGIMEAVAGQES